MLQASWSLHCGLRHLSLYADEHSVAKTPCHQVSEHYLDGLSAKRRRWQQLPFRWVARLALLQACRGHHLQAASGNLTATPPVKHTTGDLCRTASAGHTFEHIGPCLGTSRPVLALTRALKVRRKNTRGPGCVVFAACHIIVVDVSLPTSKRERRATSHRCQRCGQPLKTFC